MLWVKITFSVSELCGIRKVISRLCLMILIEFTKSKDSDRAAILRLISVERWIVFQVLSLHIFFPDCGMDNLIFFTNSRPGFIFSRTCI